MANEKLKATLVILAVISIFAVGMVVGFACNDKKAQEKIQSLEKKNTTLKEYILNKNTDIDMANEVLNNTDSTCFFIYSNPAKHRRKNK